ncbi:MAG: hypothetical protein P4L50_03110 [Anaerolineaceae bacterium]|nr:hypothetical protein [Anaerolineaceae bacterium]
METITKLTEQAELKLAGKLRKYTPEEVEAARRFVRAQNALCDPDCPLCGGIGWVSKSAELGDSDFGKVEPCPNLDITKIPGYSRTGLDSDEIKTLDWNSLRMSKELDTATNLIKNVLERGYGWIYLWSGDDPDNPGGNGLAKTLILKIAIAGIIRSRKQAAYANMPEILDDLRAAYDAKDPSEEAIRKLEFWTDIPVLAIDEFNRVNDTNWVTERRFMLMDTRYTQAIRKQSITLIASNTDPSKQESYLYDRIQDGRFKIIRLHGESARPAMDWSANY